MHYFLWLGTKYAIECSHFIKQSGLERLRYFSFWDISIEISFAVALVKHLDGTADTRNVHFFFGPKVTRTKISTISVGNGQLIVETCYASHPQN